MKMAAQTRSMTGIKFLPMTALSELVDSAGAKAHAGA
jgi:hypothetical protein